MAAVPVLTLSDEAEKPKDIPAPRLGSRSDSISAGSADQGTHIKRRTKKEEAIEYFNKYGIPDTMNALVTQLLIQKPEYPLSFCIQFLRTTAAIRSPSATAGTEQAKENSVEERMKAKLGDVSSREYLLDHKLPWMFDDLLSGILAEKPEDPQAFCLTWLRWNRSKYSENDKETDFGIQLAEIPNLSNVESFSAADL